MASKKSSRKSRKKSQSESQRKKSVTQATPEVLSPAPPTTEAAIVKPRLEPVEIQESTQAPVLKTPAPEPVLKMAASAKPLSTSQSSKASATRGNRWAVILSVAVIVGFVSGILLLNNRQTLEQNQASTNHSGVLDAMLDGSMQTATDCSGQQAQSQTQAQSLNPQSSGQQLQNVPANSLQTPQVVENQVGKNGGIQVLQPAGCF